MRTFMDESWEVLISESSDITTSPPLPSLFPPLRHHVNVTPATIFPISFPRHQPMQHRFFLFPYAPTPNAILLPHCQLPSSTHPLLLIATPTPLSNSTLLSAPLPR
ncbi:hypothetical protein NL676_027613 [Syzygium grande]|nr:hypothetical protein NL676_027613 [Syzygium grande]